MSLELNDTSGWYLVRWLSFRSLSLTIWRKYQLRAASMIQIKIFEALSQYLLIVTKLENVNPRNAASWDDNSHLDRRINVCRYKDAEYSNVDNCCHQGGAPFKAPDCLSGLGDDTDSVDDDLE
jgi:hypothetical protein